MCVCWCTCVQHACGGQRIAFGSQFSPSTVGFKDLTQVVLLVKQALFPALPSHGTPTILG